MDDRLIVDYIETGAVSVADANNFVDLDALLRDSGVDVTAVFLLLVSFGNTGVDKQDRNVACDRCEGTLTVDRAGQRVAIAGAAGPLPCTCEEPLLTGEQLTEPS